MASGTSISASIAASASAIAWSAPSCVSNLESRHTIGLGIMAQAGIISVLAIMVLACFVIRNILRAGPRQAPAHRRQLIQSPLDAYIISLLLADSLQGIGSALSAKWAVRGQALCSSLCTSQGVLLQAGETAAAMSTLAIAIHVFATVCRRWRPAKASGMWKPILMAIWGYVWLLIIGSKLRYPDAKVYTPSPYWCWIGSGFTATRLMGQFAWMWLTAVICAIVMIPIYLRLRGGCSPASLPSSVGSPAFLVHTSYCGESSRLPDLGDGRMLWVSALYVLLVTPYSAARWYTFDSISSGHEWVDLPFEATVVFTTLFNLSGFFHVLILWLTCSNLWLLGPASVETAAPARSVFLQEDYDCKDRGKRRGRYDLDTVLPRHIFRLGGCSSSEEDSNEDENKAEPDEKDFYKTVKLRPSMFGITSDARCLGKPPMSATPAVPRFGHSSSTCSVDMRFAVPWVMHSPASYFSQPSLEPSSVAIDKSLPPVPSSSLPTRPPASYRSRVSCCRPATESIRGSAKTMTEGWWEVNEIGSIWLDVYSRPATPSLRYGGLARPDSLMITWCSSPSSYHFDEIPISLPSEWKF